MTFPPNFGNISVRVLQIQSLDIREALRGLENLCLPVYTNFTCCQAHWNIVDVRNEINLKTDDGNGIFYLVQIIPCN